MADLYICSDCGRTMRDAEAFVRHCEVTGHGGTELSDPDATVSP